MRRPAVKSRPLVLLVMVALFSVGVVLVISHFESNGDSEIDVPLTTFIAEARAGNIEIVEVDNANLRFKLNNDPDRSFRATMERGYTLRRILEEAGIEPQDFPPVRLK